MTNTTKINLATLAATAASAALVLGDVFALGHTADMKDYPAFSPAYIEQLGGMVPAPLLAAPMEQLMISSLAISFSIPFLVAAMWLVGQTLRNRDQWYSTALFWGLMTSAALFPLVHARFFFVAGLLKTIVNTDPSAHPILLQAAQDFMRLYYIGWGIAMLVITISWITYMVFVFLGKPYLPRKAGFVTPFFLLILLNLLLNLPPANPITTTFGGSTLSLAYLLFFIFFGLWYRKPLLMELKIKNT